MILDTYGAIVEAFSDFLIVATHQILFHRGIYPSAAFVSARKYNLPVKEIRHPKVCRWIQDAVAAVKTEMLKCAIQTTSILIYGPPPDSRPLERYQIDTSSFPIIPKAEMHTPFVDDEQPTGGEPEDDERTGDTAKPIPSQASRVTKFQPPPASDLPEQFRATLSRLSSLNLDPLPADCTFTVVIELRDEEDVDPPISRDQSWIAAEPAMQKPDGRRLRGGEDGEANPMIQSTRGRDRGGVKTTPIRKLEAGAFVMEVWVEEGRGKFQARVEDE